MLRAHLDRVKWKDSAVNTEQLKSPRWMIGTGPRASSCPGELRRCLTVTPESQVMHLKLVINSFQEATRRVRVSAKSRMRITPEQFDLWADFAAMYGTALHDARQLATFTEEKEAAVMRCFFQKHLVLIRVVET